MKLKKLLKVLPSYIHVRVWGNDEEEPIYDGNLGQIPYSIANYKLTTGEDGVYVEPRGKDPFAIFVEEPEEY